MRLLVLEDEPAGEQPIRDLCGWALELTHHRALADTLHAIADRSFDALLVAGPLPDGEVLDAVRHLSKGRPNLPIVALCAFDNQPKLELLRAGAQDSLYRKEADSTTLHRALLHAIERQRAFASHSQRVEHSQAVREQLATQERLTALGQLAAGVAHEINNPAAYVLSNLEASLEEVSHLRQESADPSQPPGFLDARLQQVYGKLELAFEGMRRIQSVMRELRSFGRTDLVAQPFQLVEAVESAVRLVRNQVDQVASLEVAIDPELVIAGTSDAVTQVITNLILNATQAFSRSKPDENLIRVVARSDAGWVRVVVQDNGPGIAPELQSRIFEPFVTTKSVQTGMGLGLSICRDIAVRHGGSLDFEDVAEGASFVLTLPRSQKRVREAENENPAVAGLLDHKPVVLLIEDEPHIRLSFASALSNYAEVLTADSGQSGMEMVRSTKRIDVILCDLAMPRMSGPEFYTWLEQNEPALCRAVVFVTGGAFNSRAEAFLRTHDVKVVHKPCTRRELRGAIEDVTRGSGGSGPQAKPPRPVAGSQPDDSPGPGERRVASGE